MSLAETQPAASAVSLSPVGEWARSCSAASECELQGTQKKKGGVCLSQWAKSILLKQMVGRVWDFNHRNKARNLPFFRSAHNTRARAERDGAGRVIGNYN